MKQSVKQDLQMENLEWLVHLARPFPVRVGKMQKLARHWGFDRHVQKLLERFPDDEEFESGEDFLTRCEELDFLAREEAGMPYERLGGPQD